MKALLEKTISEIVAEDFRTATTFKENNLDAVCQEHYTIAAICKLRNIDATRLSAELQAILGKKWKAQINFQQWPADLLINYIIKKHHRYVKDKAPVLLELLQKIAAIHGAGNPELFTVYRIFNDGINNLMLHIKKEEEVVFPFIEKMICAGLDGNKPIKPRFGYVNNPIDAMIAEHQHEGDRFSRMATVSNGYCPPAGACNTYCIAYAMLKEFEADLREHVWLENDILVPKVIDMEQQLMN